MDHSFVQLRTIKAHIINAVDMQMYIYEIRCDHQMSGTHVVPKRDTRI